MAGACQIVWARSRTNRSQNRARAVAGGNSRGDAFHSVNGFAKRRAEVRGVDGRHQRQPQRIAALAGQRQANEAASVHRHEVDDLRRHLFGGDGKVALVLAVLVVHYDEHAPRARFLDGFGNGSKWHVFQEIPI